MKLLLTNLFLAIVFVSISAQDTKIPVQINLKDGKTIPVSHFGKLKCDKNIYLSNYIYVRGMYLGSVTELKDFSTIEKIVLEGYKKAPIASVGNEKATIRVFKKDGVSVDLEEAEMFMTCYGVGDKYNEIVVQIHNPLTNGTAEKTIATKDIQSIIFK